MYMHVIGSQLVGKIVAVTTLITAAKETIFWQISRPKLRLICSLYIYPCGTHSEPGLPVQKGQFLVSLKEERFRSGRLGDDSRGVAPIHLGSN